MSIPIAESAYDAIDGARDRIGVLFEKSLLVCVSSLQLSFRFRHGGGKCVLVFLV